MARTAHIRLRERLVNQRAFTQRSDCEGDATDSLAERNGKEGMVEGWDPLELASWMFANSNNKIADIRV
jgi:hypothetical protein